MFKLTLMFGSVKKKRWSVLGVGIALCLNVVSLCSAEPDFLRDVRPVLAKHCLKCHGPDEGARKSGLRLDLRDSATGSAKSGKVAIVPSAPDKSELVHRIFSDDPEEIMPPPATKNPLTDAERQILKQWIAAGAEYKPHWAFSKPKQAPLPEVKQTSWPQNGIDYFVLARLEKEGLGPSTRADKYTLVRRLYLDLIGLPPTPEQAEEFVRDESATAYERLVDDLLASPHYGERWARRWLDLARYADTNGYEKDRPRSIWPYRDWVIKALNADMPFDEFTIEQIAGDMLPHATSDQLVATGFHRNTMLNEEGGIDPQEYRFYSLVDRVHVTATTWLGLTMACAQCHTHKFDPIQHSEYYQFMAFLNNADELKTDVPDPKIAAKRQEGQAKIDALVASLPDKFPAESNIEWSTPGIAEFSSREGADGEFLSDGSFRVTGKNPDKDVYTINFEGSGRQVTHVQVEAIPDEKVVKGGPGRTDHGNFVLTEIEMETQAPGGAANKVKFARGEADFSQDGFPPDAAFDGKAETGWAAGTAENKRLHRHVIFSLAEPLALEKGTKVTVRLRHEYGGRHTLGRFRLSLGNDISPASSLVERRHKTRDRKFAKWIQSETAKVVEWKRVRPVEAKSGSPILTVEADDSVFASGDFTKSDNYTLNFRDLPEGIKAFRIEVLPDDRLPNHGPGTVHYEGPEGDFFLSNVKASVAGKKVALKNATESFANGNNTAAMTLDGDLQSGWSIDGGQGRSHNAVFQFSEPLGRVEELQLDLLCERYYAAGIGKFRIWVTTENDARASTLSDDAYEALLKYRGEPKKSLESAEAAKDRELLMTSFVQVAPELASERREIEKLRGEMPKFPTSLVMHEWDNGHIRVTQRHHRGEFLQAKEEVKAGVPSFLPPLPEGAPHNRLTFAKWLVSQENPLTARVMVNRHWEAFFGRGIVRTLEDFGFQGELPSHPELLDWLAIQFMQEGWSQKKLHKLILMSATYQQSSRVTPELIERDPLNVLLTRGPRFRLEAELVRDAALVASGLISEKLGGPSVYPPQPAGVSTEGAYGQLQWKVSEGPDRYRRGLYTFAKRTTPYAMTATFDGPSGEACLARRDRSNTPLQALTLLNDEVFMDCSRALGRWAASQTGGTESTIDQMFKRCLTRPPSSDEKRKLASFYAAQLERFGKGELKASEVVKSEKEERLNEEAAWTTVARVLLNLDETISKS
jgi:hypothetical protein